MILVALALAALTPPSPPAWCADAQRYAAAGPDMLEPLLATFPAEAQPVVSHARELASAGGAGRAFEAAAAAVAAGCAPPAAAVDTAATAARVQRLMNGDPRFGGVREGDDVIDRIKHKIYAWIASLFESAGMAVYASSARTIYLALLVVVVAFVAVRLVRKLVTERAHRARAAAAAGDAAVERRRKRAFDAWREDAERFANAGRARDALRAGQAALLARVGELDDKAITPARTHREILARLRDDVAARVRAPLVAFDVAWFGKDAVVDDARAFLRAVDAAERGLSSQSPSQSQSQSSSPAAGAA